MNANLLAPEGQIPTQFEKFENKAILSAFAIQWRKFSPELVFVNYSQHVKPHYIVFI